MKIEKLRVKPKKIVQKGPCAMEFAGMLACWATSKDLGNTDACAQSAKILQDCMQKQAGKGGQRKNTMNYHLARFSKVV